MCIKQVLNTISRYLKKVRASKPRIIFWVACHLIGYCPSSDEIKNSRIKELANRLRGISEKETLTKVLEWQDRNIEFWNERHPIPIILWYIILLIFPALFIIGIVTSLVFLIVLNIQLLPRFLDMWITGFAASIATTISIAILIVRSRKISLQEFFNAFKPSIPINTLLTPKLGVCRDYTKLTACLLLNINPNAEIYFVQLRGHAATGIKVETEYYMLDQHLPVLTIDQWDKREHSSKTAHKLVNNRLESVNYNDLLSSKTTPKLTEKELIEKMSKLLNISAKQEDKKISVLRLRKWTKGAILYPMNDEIVNYSLAQALKNRISNELIELDQVTKLEVEKDDDDLIFKISFLSNELKS